MLAVLLFIPSQVLWLWQVRALGIRFIRNQSARRWLGWSGVGIYLALLAFNMFGSRTAPEPAHLTLKAALLQAPFRWWLLSSLLGFVAMAAFYLCGRAGRAILWVYRKVLPPPRPGRERLLSPERRHFLARTAVAMSATPFAACAYGLLIERTEVEPRTSRSCCGVCPRPLRAFALPSFPTFMWVPSCRPATSADTSPW